MRFSSASGLFLFGFTYLYVGIGLLGGFDTTGVGYFSLFVAIMALGYSFANFQVLNDRPFAVIWLYWAFLWFLFFLLLGLKQEHLTAYTGWVTAIEGWVTGAIPAFLLLTGYWQSWNQNLIAIVLARVRRGGVRRAVAADQETRGEPHSGRLHRRRDDRRPLGPSARPFRRPGGEPGHGSRRGGDATFRCPTTVRT